MNIDAHRARMLAGGNDTGEVIGNSTKNNINKLFKDSPFYHIVKLDGVDTEVRVMSKSVSDSGRALKQKDLAFRPDMKPNVGSMVEYDGQFWLLIDFNNNDVFPVGIIHLCNTTFTIKGEPTQTLVGYDQSGRPIYDTVDGVDTEIPCIAENRIFTADNNQAINLPDGRLQVTLPYMEYEQLSEGKEFTMYGINYKIIGVDKTKSINEIGLLIIMGERSS